MPDFKLRLIAGNTYSRKNLKNRITFINLWFEACAPCIAEMEPLNNLYTTFSKSKEFQMLSVTFEKKGTILRIIKKYKIKYPQISTSQDSCYIVNFRKGFPTNMIINKKGKIAYFTFGGATDPEKAKEDFEKNIYPILRKLLGKNDIL